MFRAVMCVAVCALPFVMSSAASAQSYVSLSGQVDEVSSAPLAPPTSITQKYVPRAGSSVRELSLLVDDQQTAAAPAPVASIAVTSSAPLAQTASRDLGIGRPTIVVSNVKGITRE